MSHNHVHIHKHEVKAENLVYLINIFSDKVQFIMVSSKYNKRIITPKGRYHPRILK